MNKKYLSLLVVVFFFFPLFAHTQTTDEVVVRQLISGGTITNLDTQNNTTLKDYWGNYWLLDVLIEGKMYLFLYDTGCTITALSKNLPFGTNELASITVTDMKGNDADEKIYKTDLSINGTVFKDIAFVKFDLNQLNTIGCMKIDGILGANLIKKCNWKIDLNQRKIFFSKTPFVVDNSLEPIPMKWYNDLTPILKLNYKGIDFVALLDTGFSGKLKISNEVYGSTFATDGYKTEKGTGTTFVTINAVVKEKLERVILNDIYFGKKEIDNLPVLIDNSKPMLGCGIFGKEEAIFNFTENQVYISPATENTAFITDVNICRNETDSSKIEICFLWNTKETKEIRLGDTIISFDGIDTSKVDEKMYCNIQSLLKSKKNIPVVIKRGNKTIAFLLNK